MKTPKRTHFVEDEPEFYYFNRLCPNRAAIERNRWKRKNRIKQLKASLTEMTWKYKEMLFQNAMLCVELNKLKEQLKQQDND